MPRGGPARQARRFALTTLNTTGINNLWNSLVQGAETARDVLLVQEHRLVEPRIPEAFHRARQQGHATRWSAAEATAKGGVTAGTAVMWNSRYRTLTEDSPCGANPSHTAVAVACGQLTTLVVSVYGHAGNTAATFELLAKLRTDVVDLRAACVIGGDFNVPVAETHTWLRQHGVPLTLVETGPTCYTPGCEPGTFDYFLVSPFARTMRPQPRVKIGPCPRVGQSHLAWR